MAGKIDPQDCTDFFKDTERRIHMISHWYKLEKMIFDSLKLSMVLKRLAKLDDLLKHTKKCCPYKAHKANAGGSQ